MSGASLRRDISNPSLAHPRMTSLRLAMIKVNSCTNFACPSIVSLVTAMTKLIVHPRFETHHVRLMPE